MSYEEKLQAFVGKTIVERRAGQDPVNTPMIRHWVEAMGLPGGIHLDDNQAQAAGRQEAVAPVAMAQAWTMRGYGATVNPPEAKDGFAELVDVLDEGGYTSVVATNSDFEFSRELQVGDEVSYEEVVTEISEEKSTGLGEGRFITTTKTYFDGTGQTIATQVWRTLRFKPRN